MNGFIVALSASLLQQPALLAQQPDETGDNLRAAAVREIRPLTVLGGVGTTMGVLGGQVEARLASSPWTGFFGLGYTPAFDQGDPSGLTPAFGVRWHFLSFERGRSRLFAEASWSQVEVRGGTLEFSDDGIARIVDGRRHFGPALEGGYRITGAGGFVFIGAIGVGLRTDNDTRTSGRLNFAATIGFGAGL